MFRAPLRHGMSLVEIVVAMGMVVFFATSFVALIGGNYGRINQARDQTQASFLLQEATNALRTIARRDFASLEITDEEESYGLASIDGVYTLTTDPASDTVSIEDIDYVRTITIAPVYRDAQNMLGDEGDGNMDPKGRLATITVTWTKRTQEMDASATVLLTDWGTNSIIYDAPEDFLGTPGNTGKFHNTVAVRELFNGEVRPRLTGKMTTPIVVEDFTKQIAVNSAPVDAVIYEQNLYVLTRTSLSVFSLSDISQGNLQEAVPTFTNAAYTFSSLAVTDNRVFAGDTAGIIHVFEIDIETGTMTEDNSIDDLLNTREIKQLAVDNDYLLIGRASDDDTGMEFEVTTPSGQQFYPSKSNNINEAIAGVAFDDDYFYVAAGSRVYVLNKTRGAIVTFTELPSPSQSITSLAHTDSTLLVSREIGAAPELQKIHIIKNEQGVILIAEEAADIDNSVRRVLLEGNSNIILASTDSAQQKIRVFSNETLAQSASVDMSSLTPAPVSSSACYAMSYEVDRLFLLCDDTAGNTNLYMIVDSAAPTSFRGEASYISPVKCVDDADFTKWKNFMFEANGDQGTIVVTLRGGSSPTSMNENSVSQIFVQSGIWHDLTSFYTIDDDKGLMDGHNCIQFTAHYLTSPYCPLALESVVFTYE